MNLELSISLVEEEGLTVKPETLTSFPAKPGQMFTFYDAIQVWITDQGSWNLLQSSTQEVVLHYARPC